MTNAWIRIDRDERLHDLNLAKHEALGALLGMVDVVLIAQEHPTVLNIDRELDELRKYRLAYRLADAAYIDARRAS